MRFVVSVLILFACFYLQAQSSGYLGKRTFIEADGLGNMPLFGRLFNGTDTYYKKQSANSLTKSNNLFDYGWRVSLARVSKRNVGIGFEVGYDYQNCPTDFENTIMVYDTSEGYNKAVKFDHEMLDVSTINFLPKLIITNKGGLVPVGFTHEMGVGYSSSKIAEHDYVVQGTFNASLINDSVRTYLQKNYVDYNYRFSGFTILYGVKMHVPVSKRILLNYGLRYTLHLRNVFNDFVHSNNQVVDDASLQSEIGRTRFYNFITLNVGVTYTF